MALAVQGAKVRSKRTANNPGALALGLAVICGPSITGLLIVVDILICAEKKSKMLLASGPQLEGLAVPAHNVQNHVGWAGGRGAQNVSCI